MATAAANLTGTDKVDYTDFQPGVLAGVEVSFYPDAQLDTKEISALKALNEKASRRDYPARLIEVIQAWESALFYRGFQFLIPLRGGGWKIPGESTGYGPSMQMDLSLLPTNIYSAYSQIIISALTRSVPNTRFEAQDGSKDAQISAAQSAGQFLKVFRRDNDPIVTQTDACRYLWCDGRFIYWTRFERDGQRFGWEENDEPDDIVPENEPTEQMADQMVASEEEKEVSETADNPELESEEETTGNQSDEESQEELAIALQDRTPRGREVRSAHGKLEFKMVPMMANSLDECDVVQYETEIDVARAKGMFPKKAKDIKAGGFGVAEGAIARLARQNVKLGMQATYVTSDSVAEDVTIQRSWMRPAYFMHIPDDAVRDSIIKKFPDGVLTCWAGETFCYARNESMNDSLALGQAYSGDGQNRNALGTSVMPVQKRLNNWLDLMNDYFVRGIPKIWMDNKAFDLDALRNQSNIPGDRAAFKRQGLPVDQLVWAEPRVEAPASLPDFVKQYSGPLAELLSGGYPALAGGQTDTDTFRGMALQRDQALGRLGPTWHQIQMTEAESSRQAVRWGAKMRKGTLNERIPGGETIRLEVNDLKANIMCYPESDENFPESYPQKQQRLVGFMQDSAKNPALQEALYNPANISFILKMTGLTDLWSPEVAAWEKQLGELELLKTQEPIPNPQIIQAQKIIAQLKAHDAVDPNKLIQAENELIILEQTQPEVSSITADTQIEDNATEALGCWHFMMGPSGRKLKRTGPRFYENVRLHYLQHKDAAEKADAMKAQHKPPSESINFKDVAQTDAGAAKQMLGQAGLQPTPEQSSSPGVPSQMPNLATVAQSGSSIA